MDRFEEMLGQALDNMVDEEMEIRERERESYNKAIEDVEERFKEWLKSEYGKVADENMLTIRVLRSLSK